jgi:hypothetical protein
MIDCAIVSLTIPTNEMPEAACALIGELRVFGGIPQPGICEGVPQKCWNSLHRAVNFCHHKELQATQQCGEVHKCGTDTLMYC